MFQPEIRSVYFVSLGCPKNRVDSEVMLGLLGQAGLSVAQEPEEAQAIIVNTCGFVEASKKESIDTILEMSRYKDEGTCKKLIVAGCLAQRYAKELAIELPEVDHIIGTGEYHRVAKLLSGDEVNQRAYVGEPVFVHDASLPKVRSTPRHYAYLKIAEGCSRRCAFCIIPKLRGDQRSRSIEDVVVEANALAKDGCVELNLVSQDLTFYGRDLPVGSRPDLAGLLRELVKIRDIQWIRLHYAYPAFLTDELLKIIANEEKIVKYVDIPLQHASDRMLKAMKRGHGAKTVQETVAKLRSSIPGLALRTTFIVGYPGETEEDFDELLQFVKTSKFERVGCFTYSPEEGTPAATMKEQVPTRVKGARYRALMREQKKISRAYMKSLLGTHQDVLIDGPSPDSPLLLAGRLSSMAPEIDGSVYITDGPQDGSLRPGAIVKVRFDQAEDYDLAGPVVGYGDEPEETETKKPKSARSKPPQFSV
jgi:ribosomal protein S12 methylthiotransferase